MNSWTAGRFKMAYIVPKSPAVDHPSFPHSIFPLGDSAITIDFGNCIDEQHNISAQALYEWLRLHPFPGILDIIMAYSSVSVLYDPAAMASGDGRDPPGAYPRMAALLERACREADIRKTGTVQTPDRVIEIPVCYEGEYAPDLPWVAERTGLSPASVIDIHLGTVYRIYMVGFLPGFPYMGALDQRLSVPRKEQPVNVVAGGVGIAGKQTGIYPLNSPGGWQIIGRTPVSLFDRDASPPVRLRSGDQVRFRPVSPEEFKALAARPA